jgi:carbon storage regulator
MKAMLVLSRDVGERIIAGDVVITLVAVRSSTRARLGIDAPREVPVHRQEIHDTIIREQGPFPETRRVPVELLERIADMLVCVGDGAAKEREELDLILEGRKDGR